MSLLAPQAPLFFSLPAPIAWPSSSSAPLPDPRESNALMPKPSPPGLAGEVGTTMPAATSITNLDDVVKETETDNAGPSEPLTLTLQLPPRGPLYNEQMSASELRSLLYELIPETEHARLLRKNKSQLIRHLDSIYKTAPPY
jgi:hypothetical protein